MRKIPYMPYFRVRGRSAAADRHRAPAEIAEMLLDFIAEKAAAAEDEDRPQLNVSMRRLTTEDIQQFRSQISARPLDQIFNGPRQHDV